MAETARSKLLTAAENLFYANGFHATGIERIVAAAGVVRMTLYKHFPSKEALIQAVLAQRHKRFMAQLDAALAQSASGEATRNLVAAHHAWLAAASPRGCILVQAQREFAHESDAITHQVLDAKADLRARLRHALARDGLTSSGDTEPRLFMALEGATAAMPVLGPDAVERGTQATVEALIAEARRGQA